MEASTSLPMSDGNLSCEGPVEIEFADDFSALDGEVCRRLNHMTPVPHIPKINGDIPSVDEEISDHQRLLDRLKLYDLVELKVQGDGNCQVHPFKSEKSSSKSYDTRPTKLFLYCELPQHIYHAWANINFRALSDQFYRTPEHHKFVRDQVVDQLKSHREVYEGYVPMSFDEYLRKMCKSGEWGDHVTLQAAADSYGVKIFILTSFKDTCYIEILPSVEKSKRVICLSFWAEVHYNSIYPEGEFPAMECKKKKRWWHFGI
ncbi:OVARIAN TUMOR DOMAIN-containing deubiquitinating enzyme 9-like isoform X1 [Zingiber officinale]|uniref:OVARIAN TUMOR DOMAIN-containing deubiquitinating enzyme 9-like isoform X1 n=1 Tax=Zingiber officinale TaxID=94328 RepID=UPI001C4BE863|nr:OVARIAN TUMOR DOMAIN-containing deubiquitinating enzyme 9-like isoform X1 [Zingiber officinale]XP_042375838.1 OVARIAN TUMOR DOMAIN-containing deubiquitinating enzyme 9-like isoform X1 [Zingiber officinale]